uniref:cytochrome c oxidase subunit II n=1 Tax=Resomia ornicephala TaxID=557396 RepID=UPI0026E37AE5|nr:cytochrome c oxidase subunit II [Resomia ornicephala]WJJ70065.1 cytochrome c oxidase subunit 2 [Resomia ornicephala]WJJ70077.1 cytochrome c oxidase subunit 2 [Resomia ornicephala]
MDIFINCNKYYDGAEFNQLSFQDVGSPLGEQLIYFHDNVMFIVVVITVLVGWLMMSSFINLNYYKYLIHGTVIEVIWTIIPAIILLFIAFPSLQLLYSLDEITDTSLTIKAVGHQWYWSYEYSDIEDESIEYDSYMMSSVDLEKGDLRLLEVDNRIVLPVDTRIRVIVTGADVIHCFTIPSLGIKVDAIPGRLNQVSFLAKRPGVYYGQCSEICGSDHSFMPIVAEITSQEKFVNWISNHDINS